MGALTFDDVMTTAQVSVHFKVDPDTVRRWIIQKKLQSVKVGNQRFIPKVEVRRLEKLLSGKGKFDRTRFVVD